MHDTDTKPERAARHDFEGQRLTVAEIRARVPALSEDCIRDHLRAGRCTVDAMLSYRRTQPKPTSRQQMRIRYRLPHAFGGPAPITRNSR